MWTTCAHFVRKSANVIRSFTVNRRQHESAVFRLNYDTPCYPMPPNTSFRTFSQLIEGDCNRQARRAGLSAAAEPGATPHALLFICGATGLGKTHLGQAIGHAAHLKRTARHTAYIPCEMFLSGYREAIRHHNIASFLSHYTSNDLLIIDDVQMLVGKPETQALFGRVLEAQYLRRHQMVLCADRAPTVLPDLDSQLRALLTASLTVEVTAPSFETRLAIVLSKAATLKLKLLPEVAEYVARAATGNVRQLEGIINRLAACTLTHPRRPLTLRSARALTGDILGRPRPNITPELVQAAIANHYDLPMASMTSRSRHQDVVRARHEAIYLCCQLTDLSLKSIGRYFGGRDHTTIIRARDGVRDRSEHDPGLAAHLNGLARYFDTVALTSPLDTPTD